jgi:hypothetical protein
MHTLCLGLALRRRRVAWRLLTRLRCPALSCLVLPCRCAVTAVIVTTSPIATPASHTRRAITIFAGGDSSAVIGSSRSLPVAEDTGGSSLY